MKSSVKVIKAADWSKTKIAKIGRIGEIYKSGPYWGYCSYRMEIHSGGLTGHWGMDTRREAIRELIRTHKEYGGRTCLKAS